MRKIFVFSFMIALVLYLITSTGNTPYDYFTRLSEAFLNGHFFLVENPPWLNELIPGGGQKFFVALPPMPAIISLPFVTIFGGSFPQQYIAHLLGAAIVVLTVGLSYRIKRDKKLAIWSGLLVGAGSIVWFLSADGSAWYLGQLSAALFLTAAIFESLGRKRAFLIGVFLGVAYLSRLHTILSLPFFIYFLKGPDKRKDFSKLFAGILPFFLFNAFYNYTRFGVIWDKGYLLIPGVLSEPWFQKGLVHPIYIIRHLKIVFGALPKLQSEAPFLLPSWNGLAIWVTTPAFIYSLKAPLKKRIVKFSWLAIFLISLAIFTHGTTGFTQFGYRFAVDFYPFLILLTIIGVSRKKLKWHHWLLLFLGIAVNTWGVVWINKFGWVSF